MGEVKALKLHTAGGEEQESSPPLFLEPRRRSQIRDRLLEFLPPEIKSVFGGELFHGKLLRSGLCIKIGRALDLDSETYEAIAFSIEYLHEASLIHDDLQDHQSIRRGRPSIWKKFGLNQAINLGDLLLSLSSRPLLKMQHHQSALLLSHLSQVTQRIIEGQILEQSSKQNLLSIKDYEEIAHKKTACLISAGPELLCLASQKTLSLPAITDAFIHFGLAFQFENDRRDFRENRFPRDVKNQITSLPLILAADSMLPREKAERLLRLDRESLKILAELDTDELDRRVWGHIAEHLRVFQNKLNNVSPPLALSFEDLLTEIFPYYKSSK